MIIYIFILFFLYLFWILFSRKKNVYYWALIPFFTLWFISAFRDVTVGTDTKTYKDLFTYYNESKMMVVKGEYLFSFMTYLIKSRGGDYRHFLMLDALLFYLPICYAIKIVKLNPLSSITFLFSLGFCFSFFNISRQMTAVSFSLLAFIACSQNKNILFLILVIISFFIHTSSVILLLFWLVYKLTLSPNKYILILLFSFFIPFLLNSEYIADLGIRLFPFLDKYSIHVENETAKSVFSINRLLLNVLFIFYLIDFSEKKDNLSFWMQTSVWGVVLLNLFPTNPIISRTYYYFSITQIFSLSECCNRSLVLRLVSIAYSIVIFLFLLYSNIGEFIPYSFSFN